MIAVRREAPLRGRLRFGEAATRHSAWGLGGAIARFYEPADVSDLLQFLRVLPPTEPITWLGAGSNLLVRDGGYSGTLIAARRVFDAIDPVVGGTVLVGAGVRLPKLARYLASRGLRGIEPFADWPHTLGGALHTSVTRAGRCLWQAVEEVETLERNGRVRRCTLADLRAGCLGPDTWLIAARLRLERDSTRNTLRALAGRLAAARPLGRGPLLRATGRRAVHELVRQAGLGEAACGGAALHPDDGNYMLLRPEACVDDVEGLLGRVQATIHRRLGVRVERQVRLIGRRRS